MLNLEEQKAKRLRDVLDAKARLDQSAETCPASHPETPQPTRGAAITGKATDWHPMLDGYTHDAPKTLWGKWRSRRRILGARHVSEMTWQVRGQTCNGCPAMKPMRQRTKRGTLETYAVCTALNCGCKPGPEASLEVKTRSSEFFCPVGKFGKGEIGPVELRLILLTMEGCPTACACYDSTKTKE